ncbi:Alkaline phosphatase [Methanosarcina horonobensis HB-1 = JCM 15518]|uniref:Alkaline phosphatase n=1 Tax=Methanosarcina horonobensis HB-1 = JCM 15518 TaxID=1434110 RepID=A0A0E3SC01_9EURY|nr:alkaline phosphatase [Methanosarcina horonobensis]AKB76818.1 Alkaline phosphatase [Methanosarcina horonobensis HB-1 = JCM 15518]
MESKETNILLTFSIIGLLLLGNVGSAVAVKDNLNNNSDFNDSVKCKPVAGSEAKIKNVIVMVPDGCSQSVQTLARWYGGEPLQLDEMVAGTVSTYSADSVITDSSSAATAFATGFKTTNGFVSVGPRNDTLLSIVADPAEEYSPLATVLEGSKLEGRATGLVATSRVTHATPAAFASHVDNRNNESEIMEQMVYEDIDVVFGGGSQYLLPVADGGKRTDGENLTEVLLDRGYQYVDNETEMLALSSGNAWGLFASGHMQPDIDRAEFAPEEPSLSNMTEKAIELLCEDKDGFFLMVEGSQVDWAGHANDPIYEVTDFLAFDEAVKVAVDFARADGHTLVIVFPDHNTGGMTIGSYYDSEYDDTSIEDVVTPLEGMNITAAGVAKKIGEDLSYDNIKSQLKTWWGIDATDDDVTEILELYNNGKDLSLDYAISKVISRNHTVIGWTTNGHCGEDVPLWAFGPDSPAGYMDNTEIAEYIADKLKFDLAETNEHLFVEVGEVLSEDNGDGTLEADEYLLDTTDPENPVLKIGDAELPVNKNLLIKDGVTHELDGIVVYAMTDKVYIPTEALSLV